MPLNQDAMIGKGGEKKEYELLPVDVYESEIKDIELKTGFFKNDDGSDQQVLNFTFSIAEEGRYKGRLVWKEIKPYVKAPGEKKASMLYQVASTILGRELTKAECDTFGSEQVNALIGKRIRVSVKQKTSGSGKVYNNVTDFLPSKIAPAFQAATSSLVDDIPFQGVND